MTKQVSFLVVLAIVIGFIAADNRKFIDPQNMDMSVKPGDNFYEYANGNWLKKNEIPASKTSWGALTNSGKRASMR